MINSSVLRRRLISLLYFVTVTVSVSGIHSPGDDSVAFTCSELLGRPTDNSIALNLCADKDIDAFIEFGTQSNIYSHQSPTSRYIAKQPFTIQLNNLVFDTKYFYRVRYRGIGATAFLARAECAFQTARQKGREFTFAIEADPHLDTATNPDLYRRTLGNIATSNPDFMIDLGDTFMSDKLQEATQDSVLARHLLLRSFFETICHSVPLHLVIGNHEGELGWLLDGTSTNLAVRASNIRLQYFPNPMPGAFYSGDTTNIGFIGQRQNYYAWEWGNALFVALDPYWYTAKKPGSSKNNWDWTLGTLQYDWLVKTLQNSKADFKFVFAHQLVGGIDTEGRGGIEGVPYYEMGGLSADSTPGFAANRPGWSKPLHQLMVENHVSAFFHGHDHVYVKQDLDGIVYQELPQPGYFDFGNPEKSYSNTKIAAKYSYTHGIILSSSGYLRVTVRDTAAIVDYVRTYLPAHENASQQNGSVGYSYTIRKSVTEVPVDHGNAQPSQFMLKQNYPNPFNPSTVISYQLPANSAVTLKVYDVIGREVATLVNEVKEAGTHTVPFSASKLPSGLYYYALQAGGLAAVKAMVLMK